MAQTTVTLNRDNVNALLAISEECCGSITDYRTNDASKMRLDVTITFQKATDKKVFERIYSNLQVFVLSPNS